MIVIFFLSEQDQSMSLLSVHMGLDGSCQRGKPAESTEDMEKQEELMATGGRSFSLVRLPAVTVALCVFKHGFYK